MDSQRAADCVFCDIVAGQAPASVVYEDGLVLAIMDISPVTPGHLLVLPKRHYPFMRDMDEETGMHLFKVTLRMEQVIRESGVCCEGINLFLADGEAAFQEVFHLHMHVFPRFKGDSFRIEADWSVKPPREELDTLAAQIRRAYVSRWGNATA